VVSLVEEPPILSGVDEVLSPNELLKEAKKLRRKERSKQG